MRRLGALLLLAVLVLAAVTIADLPGSVRIAWQDWQLDTSLGVLIAAAALTGLAVWLSLALLAAAIRMPRRYRRNRRRRGGERALTRGMIALAAGDAVRAQRNARRAETLLGQTPLTLLLAAQSADLGGDAAVARQRYTALLGEREAAFLGLRGLIAQALKDGRTDDALRFAERAHALRPNAAWVFETLLALQTRSGRWEAARETVAEAARRQRLPAGRAAHHRGVILYELSRAAERPGDRRRALSLAAQAQPLTADLAAPAVRHARLLIAEQRLRAARRAVEQAWKSAPHPTLAAIWGELGGAAPALELIKWYERLAANNPDSVESALALAEAALAAQLWGEARRHLARAMAAQPAVPRRTCLLMARLEQAEHPNGAAAAEWLDRALAAPPDCAYLCARCGDVSAEWTSLCGHCLGFDTLAWGDPAAAAMLLRPDPVAARPFLALPGDLAAAAQWDR